jgi:hypothetical protein
MLVTIPIKTLPNQTTSVTIGDQNITVDLYTEDVYLYANCYLGSTNLFRNVRVVQGQYINPYTSPLKGYLFVYDLNGLSYPTWETLGVSSFLYYSDTDILALNYEAWVQQNLAELVQEYGS